MKTHYLPARKDGFVIECFDKDGTLCDVQFPKLDVRQTLLAAVAHASMIYRSSPHVHRIRVSLAMALLDTERSADDA